MQIKTLKTAYLYAVFCLAFIAYFIAQIAIIIYKNYIKNNQKLQNVLPLYCKYCHNKGKYRHLFVFWNVKTK